MEAEHLSPAPRSGPLCRPLTCSYFHVEQSVAVNGIAADIRRFGWNESATVDFQAECTYVDLALRSHANPNLLSPLEGGRMPRGEVVFLPQGCALRATNHPSDHRLLCLTVTQDRASTLFEEEFGAERLLPCLDVRDGRIREALARVAVEVCTPGFARDVLVESLAITIMVDLCRHLIGREQCPPSFGGLPGWRLRRLEEKIESRLAECISTGELAAECGMSVRHLIRSFKATTGTTLSSYIASARIERAKRELAGDGTPVKSVAARCGFQSAAAFSAAFRKATGLTPKEYREQRLRTAA